MATVWEGVGQILEQSLVMFGTNISFSAVTANRGYQYNEFSKNLRRRGLVITNNNKIFLVYFEGGYLFKGVVVMTVN